MTPLPIAAPHLAVRAGADIADVEKSSTAFLSDAYRGRLEKEPRQVPFGAAVRKARPAGSCDLLAVHSCVSSGPDVAPDDIPGAAARQSPRKPAGAGAPGHLGPPLEMDGPGPGA